MIFEPDRHEALAGTDWDPSFVRASIRTIVTDIEDSRLAEGHWLPHALDHQGSVPRTGFKTLYLGSAGIIWTLWYLQREGAVELQLDPLAAIEQADLDYQLEPDTGEVVPSYYLGEVGIRLVHWRLTQSDKVAQQLYASIKKNIPNPTNEALWAAPGTMVAAWQLWEATGDERWRLLFGANVEQLWQTWQPVPNTDYYLWTQDLYGSIVQLLGAGHGFAGNVYPLLRGASLLDAARREELYDRCIATLRATGVFEDGAANWPQSIATPRPGRTSMLMQWCHGAPGVVTSLAAYPRQRSPDMETMLLAAGEATWKAGPLSKGYGLCHGTAGNGYAFLKLHRRTGDPRWLDRARSFAMHAIGQRETMVQQYGRGRYTLWTGDPGLAVYLWHCLTGNDGLPALDILDCNTISLPSSLSEAK